MQIPTLDRRISSDFCPLQAASSFLGKRDLKDTAEAFKSWDNCMDNTLCKVIAIAGIAIGSLIILWILIAIIRCCHSGVSTLSACCFCCCSDRHHSMEPPQFSYNSPNNRTSYQPAFQPAYHHGSSGFGGSNRRSISPPAPVDVPNRLGSPASKVSPPPDYKDHLGHRTSSGQQGQNDYEWGYYGDRNDRKPWDNKRQSHQNYPVDNTQSMEMEPYDQVRPYNDHYSQSPPNAYGQMNTAPYNHPYARGQDNGSAMAFIPHQEPAQPQFAPPPAGTPFSSMPPQPPQSYAQQQPYDYRGPPPPSQQQPYQQSNPYTAPRNQYGANPHF